jgi:ATP-dependent DNA ligase I
LTLLADLVDTSRAVAQTSRRSAKIGALAAYLRRIAPEETTVAVAFLSGEPRQGKLGLGHATLAAARGAVHAEVPALTLAETDRRLAEIAQVVGRGASAQRTRLVGELFARATSLEQGFLVRLIVGGLRQGALEAVVVEAIASAASVPLADVRRAAMYANLGVIATAALTEGAPGLARFRLTPLDPVAPMLAQTAESVGEALDALGRAALDWKLDGVRVQLHKAGDVVRVYTRSLSDVTDSVPEVVAAARGLSVRSLVLDGEAIALAPGGAPLPFQVTMRRFGRKLDVEAKRAELPLTPFFFDCLRYDEADLVDRPAEERFAALGEALPRALVVPRIVTADRAAAGRFFAKALAHGHEGVMVKSLAAPYSAGNRGAAWLKVKRALSLDLVVLAAEWGHGRRKGWLSNLHLGARDPATGQFVMLGKTFKGLTDAMLAWQTRELLAREIGRDDRTVYVRPELVVEIAFDELQASTHYAGGLALRFARVKGYRTDKRAEDADTMDTVRSIHAAQFRHLASSS